MAKAPNKAKVKIVWKAGAFREIRTLPAVQADLDARAGRIASASGPGYIVGGGTTGGKGRARSSVVTGDAESMRDNARNNTLLNNFSRGQG